MNRYSFNEEKHLHLLDQKPLSGTSSISGVLPKVLTWWASGKFGELVGWLPTKADKKERLKSARDMRSKIADMTDIEYLALLDKAYKNHNTKLKESAVAGTDLHAELERFIKWKISGNCKDIEKQEFDKKIFPFIEWSDNNVKKFLWSEGYCYSEKMWVGGICDAGALLNDGTIALIDFKSAKEAYTNHFLQCAGYAIQIEENGILDKDGNQLMKLEKPIEKLIVVPFGAEKVEPIENSIGIGDLKIGFEHAVGIYRLLSLEKKKDY